MSQVLTLRVRPDWSEIDVVRSRTIDFLTQKGLCGDVVDAVAMVTCELTENANKYGQFATPQPSIEIIVDVHRSAVTVEVKHPIGRAQVENIDRLDTMIQWIRGFQDPFQAYLERIKEVSAQSLYSEESGLGLVRIAYEGQSILDFYVDENDVLAVSALYRL